MKNGDRAWGAWTEIKLDALEKYLKGFTTAAKGARGTLYIDALAGGTSNHSRETGEPIDGSSIVALRVEPPISKVVLCELDTRAAQSLKQELPVKFPHRDIAILEGDCNTKIPAYLDQLARRAPGWRYAPSFAFLDQYAVEIEWTLIEKLATFKAEATPRGKRISKTELWLYFGDSFIPRGAYGSEEDFALPQFVEKVDRLFGTQAWRELHRRRKRDEITGAEYTAGLTNFMRWRLEHDLGYSMTLPLRVLSDRGLPLYTLIFATDHLAGQNIMGHVSGGAKKAMQEMIKARKTSLRQERERSRGSEGLFPIDNLLEVRYKITDEEALGKPAIKPDWLS